MILSFLLQRPAVAGILSLVFVYAVAAQVLAKDPGTGKSPAAPVLTGGGLTERGIIVVGGKGQGEENPAGRLSDRNRSAVSGPVKSQRTKVSTPGTEQGIIIVGGSEQGKVKQGTSSSKIQRSLKNRPGSDVMLNPQPLPPKAKSKVVAPASDVMLNPQPLPPKVRAQQKLR